MKKAIALLMSAIVVGATLLTGCGGGQDTASNSETQENKDLKLTVYAGLMEDHAMLAAKEFEKATGVKTDVVRMSGGEIYARIKAEKENPSASVWYGGGALTFIAAKNDGLLENYKSPVAENIADNFKDPDGAWTGIYSGYLGIEGNKKWLEENGLELPKTWDDLLKPEFKGNIVVAHPGSSSTAYNFLATIVQLKGEEEGFKYLQKFNGQVRQYTKSGSAPGRMVGMGEAPIALGFLHDAIKYQEEGYEDIVFTAAEEGTGYEIGAVGIIKGGPDQEAAKMFVDWALSKEAQELGKTVGSFQFLTNKEANPPEQAMTLKDTKLIDYDFKWAGDNRSEFLERFMELTKTTPPTE
ncbi:MAG: ABC transporter substrate-binding protein [Tissierellales bacterium]|jgi:iron(III) transport system substrate-binding protein|nr:ABC transporter substrate-binding protein [Tissierellales bacterium]